MTDCKNCELERKLFKGCEQRHHEACQEIKRLRELLRQATSQDRNGPKIAAIRKVIGP